MKTFKNVRGSMATVSNIEVGKDTVYVRTNITQINETDFKGWQYDETQYSIPEYIQTMGNTIVETQNAINNLLGV